MPTYEMFWGQIGEYNQTFEYLHYLWIALSIPMLIVIFLKPGSIINGVWKVFMSVTFLFTGTIFFEIYSAGPVSRYFYGPLFLLVGVLLFIDIFRKRIFFRFPEKNWARCVALLGVVLVYVYPLLGMVFGRSFPYICMPMNPCPLTVLAIVMVSAASPDFDRKVLLFLLPWGLLGLPKALGLYGCYEDAILFLAGVYGLGILIANRKRKTTAARTFLW